MVISLCTNLIPSEYAPWGLRWSWVVGLPMNPERLWVSITSSSYNSLLISTDAVCARKPIVLETSARDSSPRCRRHCTTTFAFCKYSMWTLIGRKNVWYQRICRRIWQSQSFGKLMRYIEKLLRYCQRRRLSARRESARAGLSRCCCVQAEMWEICKCSE